MDQVNSLEIIFIVIILSISLPLNSQTDASRSNPEFLYPEFSICKVLLKNGNNESMMLNYNILTEKMIFIADDKQYEIVNPGMVDTIFMQGSRFMPVGKGFYEVLITEQISLLVQHKGKLLPPGKPAGYGGTSQVSNTRMVSSLQRSDGNYKMNIPSDYKVLDNPVYWISIKSVIHSFISKGQFLKIFPEKNGDLKKYIKQNRIKFDNQPDMVMLVKYCNDLYS
jgi:hypothetical protein